MDLILVTIESIFVLGHALIHMMGTPAYMKLGEIEGFEYETTIENGQLNPRGQGIRVNGLLWGAAVAGFVLAMITLWVKWDISAGLLVGGKIFTLVLTTLGHETAYMGVVANTIILAVIVLGPQIKTLMMH